MYLSFKTNNDRDGFSIRMGYALRFNRPGAWISKGNANKSNGNKENILKPFYVMAYNLTHSILAAIYLNQHQFLPVSWCFAIMWSADWMHKAIKCDIYSVKYTQNDFRMLHNLSFDGSLFCCCYFMVSVNVVVVVVTRRTKLPQQLVSVCCTSKQSTSLSMHWSDSMWLWFFF